MESHGRLGLNDGHISGLAIRLLQVCGLGPLRLSGAVDPRLVAALRSGGAIAATADDGIIPAAMIHLVDSGTIGLTAEQIAVALAQAPLLCVVAVSAEGISTSVEELDQRARHAGAVPHPALSLVRPLVPAEEHAQRWWIYQQVGTENSAVRPRWVLASELMASRWIRPGDRVLVKPGSPLLPQALLALSRAHSVECDADRPVDFLVDRFPLDTSDVAAALDHAAALLLPAGRLLLQIDSGAAASDVLLAVINAQGVSRLLPELCWVVDDGSPAVAFPVDALPEKLPAGNIFVLLMQSPFGTVEYIKHIEPGDQGSPASVNILAFARDYRYPALVRAMVSIGLRSEVPRVLEQLAQQTLQSCPAHGADAGSALCVLLYQLIARQQAAAHDLSMGDQALLDHAHDYLQLAPANPTVHRWQVSLSYALGLIFLQQGQLSVGRNYLQRCADSDPQIYSPLLATKTIGAELLLGQLAFSCGERTRASAHWLKVIRDVRELVDSLDWAEVLGDGELPVTFGMPELAAAITLAGTAVHGLHLLSRQVQAHGMQGSWAMLHASLADQLLAVRNELRSLQEQQHDAVQSRQWLLQQAEGWEKESMALRAAHLASQAELERTITSYNAEITRVKADLLAVIENEQAARAEAEAWLQSQSDGWQREYESVMAQAQVLQLTLGQAQLELQQQQAVVTSLRGSLWFRIARRFGFFKQESAIQ